MRQLVLIFALLTSPVLALAEISLTAAPDNARLYFISPQDGEKVSSPVNVRLGLSGMGVAPAGVHHDQTGHHHILVNMDTPPPMDRPLPATDQIIHLGGGQTETTLDLPSGTHRLQLLLGDHRHIPHDPPVRSEVIEIHVK